MEINGKYYPLWQQFVDGKATFVGGILEDEGEETCIVDVQLLPNGDDSAVFMVTGESFSCGFDVRSGGISGQRADGALEFNRFLMGPFYVTPKTV